MSIPEMVCRRAEITSLRFDRAVCAITVCVLALMHIPQIALAHKEPTHQYILFEAKKLLELQLNRTFPDLDNWMGSFGDPDVGKWTEVTSIAGGIYNEDQIDAIYPVYNSSIVVPRGLDPANWMFASITHFWAPDRPSEPTMLTLIAPSENIPITGELGPYPTAMMKALHYVRGQWEVRWPYSSQYWLYGYYQELPLLYKTGAFWVDKQYNYLGQQVGGNYVEQLSVADKKRLSYNILGRIAHLLGDMGVPAHVHEDEHGLYSDFYEDRMRLHLSGTLEQMEANEFITTWTGERVFREKGGFINPYCSGSLEPIQYLMYVTAQLSDHYASRRRDGNDNFEDLGGLGAIVPTVAGPTTRSAYNATDGHDEESLGEIRDALLPYVIRATAGLLFWFLVETNQLTGGSYGNWYCSQVNYLNVTNVTLEGRDYLFQAGSDVLFVPSGIVRVGYLDDDDDPGEVIVNPSADEVIFRGSGEVQLLPGFHALAGSNVHIYNDCKECDQYGQ